MIKGKIIYKILQVKDGGIWVGIGSSLEKFMIGFEGQLCFYFVFFTFWNDKVIVDIEEIKL